MTTFSAKAKRKSHFLHSSASNATNVVHSVQVTPCPLAELVKLVLFTHDILTNKNLFISQKTPILVLLHMKKIILNFYIYVMILRSEWSPVIHKKKQERTFQMPTLVIFRTFALETCNGEIPFLQRQDTALPWEA